MEINFALKVNITSTQVMNLSFMMVRGRGIVKWDMLVKSVIYIVFDANWISVPAIM